MKSIPHRYLAALLIVLQGVSVLVLMFVPGGIGVLCSAALFGGSSVAGTLARPALLAEQYGQAHYGSINVVLAFFLAGAQALAPVGASALYTLFSRYEPMLWLVTLIFVLAFGAVLCAKQSTTAVRALSEPARQHGEV